MGWSDCLVSFRRWRLLAQKQAKEALNGKITSQEEGAMEGVVVSAKKAGSTITVSVVSDKQGRLQLSGESTGARTLLSQGPRCRLRPRRGWDGRRFWAHLATTADLKLRKTRNIASQLTNAEWLLSVPGTEEQKASLLNCLSCHTLERVVRSTPRCRRIHPGHLANERLRTGEPADQAPATSGSERGGESPNSTANRPNISPPSI